MDSNLLSDEEAQVMVGTQQGANIEKNKKPAWWDHNGQFSNAIFAGVAAILVQILAGYKTMPELDNGLILILLWLVFMVCSFNSSIMLVKNDASKMELTHCKKKVFTFLTLLTGAAVTCLNAAVLYMVYKSYILGLAVVLLQIASISNLAYFELKSDQNQVLEAGAEDNEPMVKKCFIVAKVTTAACYGFLLAIFLGYLKSTNFSNDHPQYPFLVALVSSVIGCSAMVITSSPLNFRSDLMCEFLKGIPKLMPLLVVLDALLLSADVLDATMEIFVVIVPIVVELAVYTAIKKFWENQSTGNTSPSTDSGEIDSRIETVANISILVLSAIYAGNLWIEGDDSNFTWSTFFFLLALISCMIRMTLPFRPAQMAVEEICYYLPVVELLVGFAVVLSEIYWIIKRLNSAGIPIPSRGSFAPPPH